MIENACNNINPYALVKNGKLVPKHERSQVAAEHLATQQWGPPPTAPAVLPTTPLFDHQPTFNTNPITKEELCLIIKKTPPAARDS